MGMWAGMNRTIWKWLHDNFKPHVEQSFKSIGKVFNDLILFRGSAEKNTFQYFLPQTFNDSIPFEGSAEKSTSFSSPRNPNEWMIMCHQPVLSWFSLFQSIEVVRNEPRDNMLRRMSSLTTTVLQFQHMLWACRLLAWNLLVDGPHFLLLSALIVKLAISCICVADEWGRRSIFNQSGRNYTLKSWVVWSAVFRLACLHGIGRSHEKKDQSEGQLLFEFTASHFALRSDGLHVLCNGNFYRATTNETGEADSMLAGHCQWSVGSDPRCEEKRRMSAQLLEVPFDKRWK